MKLKKRVTLTLALVGTISCLYTTAVFLQLVFENDILRHQMPPNIGKHLTAVNRRSARSGDVSEQPPLPPTVDVEARKKYVPKRTAPQLQTAIPVPSHTDSIVYTKLQPASMQDVETIRQKLNSHRKSKRRKGERINIYTYSPGMYIPAWVQFHNEISRYELYNEETSQIDRLLHDMTHSKIVDSVMRSGGTQLKLMMSFEDEGQAMMKPMRFARDKGTLPDHFYFVDYERHAAEIAAFHVDRVLGFRRVPPCAGRLFNITHEIEIFAADDFRRTFFLSPAGNLCFHGVCSYYCDTGHAFCGHPDTIEGSLCAYLPHLSDMPRKTWRHPWKRSYSKRRQAAWENDPHFCARVRELPPYNRGRRLLDIMDLSVFDFLIGNLDRHHYEIFTDFGNDTFILHMDQGRGFGNPNADDLSILAPVIQCCMIRQTTFDRLLLLDTNTNVRFSQLVKQSMDVDNIAPILTEDNLLAMDRRIGIILSVIRDCLLRKLARDVIIDDGF